mgnify:CR=1 FL=1
MPLVLKMDPTSIEAGSARAEAALKGVKTGAAQAESAIDRLAREGGQSAKVLATEVTQAGRAGGGMGFQMQNAAFQVGDFAVQVAGGTSAVRALGQQLPQLLGGFGVMGAVVGAAVAILGAVVPMMFNMGDSAKEAKDNLNDLSSELADFNQNATIGATAVDALRAKYGQWAGEIQATAQWMAQVNLGQAVATLTEKTTSFSSALDQLMAKQNSASEAALQYSRIQQQVTDGLASPEMAMQALEAFSLYDDQVQQLASSLGLTKDQAIQLNASFDALHGAKSMQDIHDRAADALQVLRDMFPAGQALPGAFADAAVALQDVEAKASQGLVTMEKMPSALNNATTSAGALAGAMGKVSMAANAALSQMIAMETHRAAAQSVVQMNVPSLNGPAGMSTPGLTTHQGRLDAAAAAAMANKSAGVVASGGGGASQIDQTQQAYDSLMASLDPAVARTQDMAKAQAVVNAEMASGQITSAQAANAMDLIAKKYGEATDSMSAFKDAGASAIDRLIAGTGSLKDALRDMIKQMELAIIKNTLLAHVTGGTSSMGIGSLLMQGLFGGFHANGGTIPAGTTGVVGERGPELITAGANPINVTSNASMRAMGQQAMHITVGVAVDDSGNLKAYVRNVAQAAGAQAVSTVRRSLAGWNGQLATDGALV